YLKNVALPLQNVLNDLARRMADPAGVSTDMVPQLQELLNQLKQQKEHYGVEKEGMKQEEIEQRGRKLLAIAEHEETLKTIIKKLQEADAVRAEARGAVVGAAVSAIDELTDTEDVAEAARLLMDPAIRQEVFRQYQNPAKLATVLGQFDAAT